VYLATPALWRGGWRIPVPPDAWLVAAATGGPEPVATLTPGDAWRESRVLRWAVPAGSVYLLEFGDAERGAAWAREVHGTAYGAAPEDRRLGTAGFGVVLTGVWT
jgi:CRISPR-associated protein Cmr3